MHIQCHTSENLKNYSTRSEKNNNMLSKHFFLILYCKEQLFKKGKFKKNLN